MSDDKGMTVIAPDTYLLCFGCLLFAELAHLLFSRGVIVT